MSEVGLPVAWVVRCRKCSCTVTCRALDPQREHAEPQNAEPPPQYPVIVTCSCCLSAFRYDPSSVFRASPARGPSCERSSNGSKEPEKKSAALLVAASLIAAVRLNREEIKSSPAVRSKIGDSIRLAEMIQHQLEHR